MERKRKKYEELIITDDFMFGKVMRHPERCGKLLEIILGVKIREVVFLDDQESLNPDYKAKGIRLDIYLEDAGNSVYNVEMQAQNRGGTSIILKTCAVRIRLSGWKTGRRRSS